MQRQRQLSEEKGDVNDIAQETRETKHRLTRLP